MTRQNAQMGARMRKLILNDGWKMKEVSWEEYLDAEVPGSVYTDLMANGRMQDPFYRDNEKEALAVIEHDYEYRTVFDADTELLACDEVLLCFDGIDTLSTILLNGSFLGNTDTVSYTHLDVYKRQLFHRNIPRYRN